MNKIVRNFDIDYNLNWDYGIEISKIREDLDALEKLGATHVQIDSGISFDCPYVEIYAFSQRLETDKEYNDRIFEINRREEEQRRREIEQLERLKAKLGMS